MANVVIPLEGAIEILKRILYGNAGAENLSLRLFKNNFTPGLTSTGADFTVATFTGYANITLTSSQAAGTWAVPTSSTPYALSTYGTLASWTATTDQTIYGWYLVGATSGKVYAAQLFSSPRVLVGAQSDTITLTSKLQVTSIP